MSIAAPSYAMDTEFSAGLDSADSMGLGSVRSDAEQHEDGRSVGLERWLKRAKAGLFGVLFVIAKETTKSALFVLIGMTLDFLQMLSFPFNDDFPWNSSWTEWLSKLTRISRFHWYLEISETTTEAIFYIALAVVTLVLMNAAYVGIAFSRRKRMNMVLVRTLRSVTSLFVTVLYMPLIDIFSVRFACNSPHVKVSDSVCQWAGAEIIVKVVGILCIALLTSLSLVVEATYFDEDPASKAILARPHARVDVAYLLYKAAVSILDATLDLSNGAQQWAFTIILALGSSTFAYLYTWYPAYYRFNYARLMAVFQWGIAWASLSLVVAKIDDSPSSTTAPVLFFVGLPLALLAGALVINERRRLLLACPNVKLASPYEVELKTRFMLQAVTDERRRATVGMRTSKAACGDDSDDGESGDAREEALISKAEDVYRSALHTMGGNSLLLVFQSRFYYTVAHNDVLGARALAKAARSAPFHVDEDFVVFRRQQMCQEYFASSANESRDVIMYMTFVQSVQSVQRAELKCLKAQAAFWTELMSPSPDSTRLRTISSTISTQIAAGERAYRTLLRLSPDSASVCRMYANWLGSVMYDHERKMTYLNKATILESARDSDQVADIPGGALSVFDGGASSAAGGRAAAAGLNIDNMRDGRSAVLNLRCDEDHLGTIENANTAALRLFGYARHDLLGRHFSSLMVTPFAEAYELMATEYISSGSLAIRGTTAVFFRSKIGYIFPGRMSVKDIPGGGILPAFVAIAEPIETPDMYALVDADGTVTGCTVNCLSLFGARVEHVLDGGVSIAEWIPEYHALAQRMATHAGAQFEIPVTDVGVAASRTATAWQTTMNCGGSASVVVVRMRITASDEVPDVVIKPPKLLIVPEGKRAPSPLVHTPTPVPATTLRSPRGRVHSARGGRRASISNANAGVIGGTASWSEMDVLGDQSSLAESHGDRFTRQSSRALGVNFEGTSPFAVPSSEDPAVAIELEEVASPTSGIPLPTSDDDLPPIPPMLRLDSVTLKVKDIAAPATPRADAVGGDAQQSEEEDSRSSGSRKSSRSTRRVQTLRRTLVAANRAGMSPVMAKFRIIVAGTILAVLAVAIAAYVVERNQMSYFEESFDLLMSSGDTRFYAETAGSTVRTLSLANTGIRPPQDAVPALKTIADCADRLQAAYEFMESRVRSMSDKHALLFRTKAVPIITFLDLATNRFESEYMTLGDGIKTQVTQIRALTTKNLTGVNPFASDYFLPIISGIDSANLSKAINQSATYTLEEVKDQIDSMRRIFLAISIAGFVLVGILALGVMLPTVIFVERTSENTLRVFEGVSRDTMRRMRRRCQKKMKELTADNGESEVSDDDETGGINGQRNSGGVSREDSGDDVTTARADGTSGKDVRMRFRRSRRYVVVMGLKISTFFVLAVLFFSLSYYFALIRIQDDLNDGAVRVNYASYIRTSARSIQWLSLEMASGLFPEGTVRPLVSGSAYDLAEITSGLNIGSPVFKIPPRPSLSAAHSVLLREDACSYIADPVLRDECGRAGDGVFKNGLDQAVQWYIGHMNELSRPPATMTPMWTPMFFRTKSVRDSERLEDAFLQPALKLSADYYRSYLQSTITSSKNAVLALLVVFIVLSVLTYFFVYNRLIHALDDEMKRTRSMALMLPDEELAHMEWVETYAEKFGGKKKKKSLSS